MFNEYNLTASWNDRIGMPYNDFLNKPIQSCRLPPSKEMFSVGDKVKYKGVGYPYLFFYDNVNDNKPQVYSNNHTADITVRRVEGDNLLVSVEWGGQYEFVVKKELMEKIPNFYTNRFYENTLQHIRKMNDNLVKTAIEKLKTATTTKKEEDTMYLIVPDFSRIGVGSEWSYLVLELNEGVFSNYHFNEYVKFSKAKDYITLISVFRGYATLKLVSYPELTKKNYLNCDSYYGNTYFYNTKNSKTTKVSTFLDFTNALNDNPDQKWVGKFVQFAYSAGSKPNEVRTIKVDSVTADAITGYDVKESLENGKNEFRRYLRSRINGKINEVTL